MLTVQLKKPYKILYHKLKRYTLHYNIPADNCVIIPVKKFGEDVDCDVRWEDKEGVLHVKEHVFFSAQNIEPVNALNNFPLYEIWQHYYGGNSN